MDKYTGFEWLLIDLANHYGLDKKLYPERLAWAKDNLLVLEALVESADEPALFTAAMLAIRDVQKGLPTGHIIHLDSAASGIQILSTSTRCHIGMRNTGVGENSRCPDIYGVLTEVMDVAHLFTRKPVKLALMSYMYGSSAEPLNTFGEDHIELFESSAKEVAPFACIARELLMNAWDATALSYTLEYPDGHTGYMRVWETVDYSITEPLLDNRSFKFRCEINKAKPFSVALAARFTHGIDAFIVREIRRRCQYDKTRLEAVKEIIATELLVRGEVPKVTDRTKLVSLVGVDYLTEELVNSLGSNYLSRLLELINISLSHESFEIVTIHDSFGCNPNSCNFMRYHYNRILFDIYNSDLFSDLYYQLTGKYLKLDPACPIMSQAILDSNYPIN